jgi:hypothetical protein
LCTGEAKSWRPRAHGETPGEAALVPLAGLERLLPVVLRRGLLGVHDHVRGGAAVLPVIGVAAVVLTLVVPVGVPAVGELLRLLLVRAPELPQAARAALHVLVDDLRGLLLNLGQQCVRALLARLAGIMDEGVLVRRQHQGQRAVDLRRCSSSPLGDRLGEVVVVLAPGDPGDVERRVPLHWDLALLGVPVPDGPVLVDPAVVLDVLPGRRLRVDDHGGLAGHQPRMEVLATVPGVIGPVHPQAALGDVLQGRLGPLVHRQRGVVGRMTGREVHAHPTVDRGLETRVPLIPQAPDIAVVSLVFPLTDVVFCTRELPEQPCERLHAPPPPLQGPIPAWDSRRARPRISGVGPSAHRDQFPPET